MSPANRYVINLKSNIREHIFYSDTNPTAPTKIAFYQKLYILNKNVDKRLSLISYCLFMLVVYLGV